MCVCACVCVCALGPAYRTLNGSVLVAAKYIHYLFLIYIEDREIALKIITGELSTR